MNKKIIPAGPDWGAALAPGYCGFITRRDDIVGDGIEYFERFENGIPFVHTFVVEGRDQSLVTSTLRSPAVHPPQWCCGGRAEDGSAPAINIIEAHAGTGVARGTLNEYLGGCGANRCHCFIRIPAGYNPQIGRAIVRAAAAHIGERYAFPLILADALANTFIGHCLNRLTFNLPDRFVCWALSDAHRKICSQLVALALQSQFYLRLRGCLRRPADTIMPRELGNDPAIWEPGIYQLKNQN